jgi:hypothetical protein
LVLAVLVFGLLKWVGYEVNPRYRVHGVDADHLEIDPDPQEATRESAPKPQFSLSVTKLSVNPEGRLRFDVRVSNAGRDSAVAEWRVNLVNGGKTFPADILRSQIPAVVKGSSQTGFLIVTVPHHSFLTDAELAGSEWDIGVKDSGGMVRWTRIHR